MIIGLTVLTVLLIVAVVALLVTARQNRDLKRRLDDVLSRASNREKKAIAQSRVVHLGKISEQLAPLLPGFPDYNLKDVQWVGGTIDAIVWDGLEDERDVNVIFLDIKTGHATVNRRQRRIRDAIDARRVRFEVFRFRPERASVVLESTPTPPGLAVTDEEIGTNLTSGDDGYWDSEKKLDVTISDAPS